MAQGLRASKMLCTAADVLPSLREYRAAPERQKEPLPSYLYAIRRIER